MAEMMQWWDLTGGLFGGEVVGATLSPHDMVKLQDLSDNWWALKDKNDLAGTSHSIQIEVESKRQDIRMLDDTMVHNWGIRELQEWLVRSPIGSDKIVVIEAIERASGGASNALLKTLEEPLPHRLMIATTHSIAQLPETIVSRAMVFHMDRVSDDEMQHWIQNYLPESSPETRNSLLNLAAGRPGIIWHYDELGQLDEMLQSWKSVQSLLSTWPLAKLYQQMSAINKSGYLSIITDAILVRAQHGDDQQLYDATLDLLSKQESNVNIENLLFEWCMRIGGSKKEK